MKSLAFAVTLLASVNSYAFTCKSVSYASAVSYKIQIITDKASTMTVYGGAKPLTYSIYPIANAVEHAFACQNISFEECNIQFLQAGQAASAVIPGLGALGLVCN